MAPTEVGGMQAEAHAHLRAGRGLQDPPLEPSVGVRPDPVQPWLNLLWVCTWSNLYLCPPVEV
jgi:hypothetical protein